MASKLRLFLDTSALFAGIWSAEGGARMLLRLGEADVAQLLISPQVLAEIEQVVRRKAAQHLPTLAVLIDRSRAQVVASAPPDLLKSCREWVPHPGDAQILADAWQHGADYLVTLDRAHFLDIPDLEGQVPFSIGTPDDCLAWMRALWQTG
jgi:predicted nucleic acid-binding protein